LDALISFIPLTVLVAIILFFLKEVLEGVRRYRGDRRKKAALRRLLARECELNHWTIKTIRRIVKKIRDESEDGERTEFIFLFLKSGKVSFRTKHADYEYKDGFPLGEIHRDVMSKYLLEVAMLDSKLSDVLQKAYNAVADLEHVRNSLIYFVDPEDEQDQMHLESFVGYASDALVDIFESLNKLHIECAGGELATHRVR
jgi:hypothetical protein